MDNKTVRAEIPLFIIENKELSMSEKVLYYALCIFAGEKRETAPSLAQLAVAAGMSDRSVQRAASSLEAKRLINRQALYFASPKSPLLQNLFPQPRVGNFMPS